MRAREIGVWACRHGVRLCWAVGALATGIVMVRIAFFMPVSPKWIDSFAFIRAGQQLLHDPTRIYDQAALQGATGQPTMAFLYPPSALAIFIPFAKVADWLGIDAAAIGWLFVEVAALVTSFFLWVRLTGLKASAAAPLGAVLAISAPTVSDINSGQINGVALLLATLTIVTFHERRAGIWLGLGLAVKPALLPLFLIPLVARRWSTLVLAVAAGVGAQLCMIPIAGSDVVATYFTSILPSIAGTVVQDPNNISPANLLTTWLGGRHPNHHSQFGITPWQFPVAAGVLIVTLRVAIIGLSARLIWVARDVKASFAVVLATIPLLAGTTWLHYVVFAYPLAIVALGHLQARSRLYLIALAVLLLDPFLNLIFVPNWGTPPDFLAIVTLVHIDSITVVLIAGLAFAFWKLGLSRGRKQGLTVLSGDVMSGDLPAENSEEHTGHNIDDVVLA